MTRTDLLYTKKGRDLIEIADRLRVKVSTNRTRTQLAEAKAGVIERIIAAETALEEKKKAEAEEAAASAQETPVIKEAKAEETSTAPTPKRGALIEWNGKAQNICAWANELGVSANTLYGRIYKLGWTVEKAFTTKGRS